MYEGEFDADAAPAPVPPATTDPVADPFGAEDDPFAANGTAAAPVEALDADMFSGPAENGTADAFAAPPATEEDSPLVLAMLEKQRQRLKEQEEHETTAKIELKDKASAYLDNFYETRNANKEARLKENRDKEPATVQAVTSGDTTWERVINLIDFQFARGPRGADLSRYKNTLFAAKAKNVPVKSE